MAWFPCNIGGGGPSEIANILKGTSDPTSSIGDNGQLYLKYGDYEKHYFMDNKIIVVENKNDATDLKLYVVGLTKDTSGVAITDTDLLAYLSDITNGYLKACCTYDTADSAIQTGLLAIGDWGSGMTLQTYIPGWTQYKAGTFYGVIDLAEPPVLAQGYPSYQENSFVDPNTIVDSGVLNSFAKVNNQWQSLIGTDVDEISNVEPGLSKIILTNGQISDKTSGEYKYPVYEDISSYDTVNVKIYGTIDNVYYEDYISINCSRLPQQFSNIRLYDKNGNSWNKSLNITFSSTALTSITYTGSYENLYIDMIAIKDDGEPIIPLEKEILHSIVQDQSGNSVPVSVTFTEDYPIAFICGLIGDNVYTGAISVNALGGASVLYGLSGNRYASAGIAIKLPSNKTLTGYFPYSDGGAYYDIFGAIGMSRLPSEYEVQATIYTSNISVGLSKVYDHIVVFVGMDSSDSNNITLAMNETSIPLTVENEKFSRYSYHASQEITSDSATLNFTYSGGTVTDSTIVVFAYNE